MIAAMANARESNLIHEFCWNPISLSSKLASLTVAPLCSTALGPEKKGFLFKKVTFLPFQLPAFTGLGRSLVLGVLLNHKPWKPICQAAQMFYL